MVYSNWDDHAIDPPAVSGEVVRWISAVFPELAGNEYMISLVIREAVAAPWIASAENPIETAVQSVIGLDKLGVLPIVARTQTYVNHFKAAGMSMKHPDDLPGAAEIAGFYTARNKTRSITKKQSGRATEFTLDHDDERLRDVVHELFPLNECEAFIPADKHKFFLQAGERVKSMVFTNMGRAFVFKGKGRKGVYSTTDTKFSLRCAKNGSNGSLITVPVVVDNKGKVVNKKFLMHRMIAPMTHGDIHVEFDAKIGHSQSPNLE